MQPGINLAEHDRQYSDEELADSFATTPGIGHNGGPLLEVFLTKPQHDLVSSTARFPAFVGGFGSGKTKALICRAIQLKLAYPMCNVAYYLPTYDLVRNIAFPRFSEELDRLGVPYVLNKTFATIEIPECGQIICRTLDNPERIVGYEVADSLVDELDTLKIDQARDAWNKIIARNRQKKPDGSMNTVAVGTTPEGFRFVYEKWKKDPKRGYVLIKAPTSSNARNLPEGYIESLQDSYPSQLLAAYLDGEFVNLTAGSVYPCFDRKLNNTNVTVISTAATKETLHVGMDFNVGNMSAIVHVMRDSKPHAVKEWLGMLDTPATIDLLKAKYPGHPIFVYPDASGSSRKSNNASVSDLTLLRTARFQVMVNNTNPAVKDRVLSMNQMLCNSKGERRYLVNVDECPSYAEALEKQAYDKNGEPDKSGGMDHPNDAGGYFVCYKFPVLGRGLQRIQISGV